LHGDPVDTVSATGRKSDSGGRRGKRGKKGGPADDVAVAKVPAHPAGEHPMFKAMAAANGRHEGEDTDGEVEVEAKGPAEEGAELVPDTIGEAYVEAEDEELGDGESDDEDDDIDDDESDDEDEIDLDADDEDDDIDDDIEVIDGGPDESDDEDDSDADDVDDTEDDELGTDEQPAAVTPAAGRIRRRAAARPAGPPVHEA
jgi:ribonuclease E